MGLVDEDVTAVRRAVAGLEQQTRTLLQHYGETVDAVRLRADVGRLAQDLDLLCGRAAPAAPAPPPPAREVIPDNEYTHDFWMDAEDEGLGRYEGGRR